MHRFKAKHFPALDGLRGLAILLVIVHHQLIPLSLNGGFLGVDLFFVLSGFLITTLLLSEFDATNTISLKNFYARRALRLAPALLLYLIVALAVSYRLSPTEFLRELKLVGLSLVYLTNWRMALGWDSSMDPTAIIWSLSIEEQFYLVWPVLFFACLVCRVKRSHIAVALVVVVLSVMVHRYLLWSGGADLQRMYYGTDTRADAPLTGCLIALLPQLRFQGVARKTVQLAAVVTAAVFAYLVGTVHFTDQFLYRGGYTAIAFIAGILTWNCANGTGDLLNAIFEWSPLRWLGKISYGLYLWHWLLLKTTSFYFWVGDLDPWVRCFVAIAVSACCYYLVETPFNKLKTKFSYTTMPPGSVTRDVISTSATSPIIVSPFPPPTLVEPSGQNL